MAPKALAIFLVASFASVEPTWAGSGLGHGIVNYESPHESGRERLSEAERRQLEEDIRRNRELTLEHAKKNARLSTAIAVLTSVNTIVSTIPVFGKAYSAGIAIGSVSANVAYRSWTDVGEVIAVEVADELVPGVGMVHGTYESFDAILEMNRARDFVVDLEYELGQEVEYSIRVVPTD